MKCWLFNVRTLILKGNICLQKMMAIRLVTTLQMHPYLAMVQLAKVKV